MEKTNLCEEYIKGFVVSFYHCIIRLCDIIILDTSQDVQAMQLVFTNFILVSLWRLEIWLM